MFQAVGKSDGDVTQMIGKPQKTLDKAILLAKSCIGQYDLLAVWDVTDKNGTKGVWKLDNARSAPRTTVDKL